MIPSEPDPATTIETLADTIRHAFAWPSVENEALGNAALDSLLAERDQLTELLRELWEFTGRDQRYTALALQRRIEAALAAPTPPPPEA